MDAISEAYKLLRQQWEALGQSPENGFDLFIQLRTRYPQVPFVFYSRKVTPEDVTHGLTLGADDVIRKSALPDEKVLARLATAHASRNQKTISGTEPSAKGEGQILAVPSVDKNLLGKIRAWAESANTWIEVGAKVLGLLTAVLAFLLAKDKLYDWVRRPASPRASVTGGWDSLAVIVGWYLIVWLLLITGGVLESVFAELWKAAIKIIHFVKPPKATSPRPASTGLEQTVPKLFRLAWEMCVIVLAVVPALAYTIRLIQQ